ncbi:HupE/UreJ family protein [Geodermatophilus sp. DSM 44513]|uniref:HupE/UreJ family protein n=1 Tax=Geodermatophilus sp. DSM 44513 TaxID=1528104 RepID=UPI00126C356B|nr:HupE/UreJ family protein [Geodermatophilus sp. DSM 44513]WNV76229.1 HupE/UreJ family protein [Geodermatophilus sp. DSM 44513]
MLTLCLVAQPAWAHGVSLGQSKISQDGHTVRYQLAVEHAELVKRLSGPPPDPARPEPTPDQRTAELVELRSALAAYLDGVLRVSLGGEPCAATLDEIAVEPFRGEVYAILSSSYRCPVGTGPLTVEYGLFFDAIAAAERLSHTNVADYDAGGETGRFLFEPGARTLTVGEDDVLAAGRFVVLGFSHILAGLDHVLFVLALLLGARSVRKILMVVTAFTAAHSLTLVLASLGWLAVPAGIVEPAIALSIAGVAVQNIVQREPRHRVVVVFGFGLLHGLGFAGSLSFGDEAGWQLLTSVLAFNVGIEAGQAAIILACAPLLALIWRRSWAWPVQSAASGLIALCGLVWFISRVLLS